MKSSGLAIVFLSLVGMPLAMAKPVRGSRKSPSAPATLEREVSVPLPPAPALASSFVGEPEKAAPNTEFQLLASLWNPARLRPEVWSGPREAFATHSVPGLEVATHLPMFALGQWEWSARLGGGFQHLSREGELRTSPLRVPGRQSLWAFPLRAGLDLMPSALKLGPLEPSLGVAFMPTWLVFTESVFADEGTHFVPALETSFQLRVQLGEGHPDGLARVFGTWNLRAESEARALTGFGVALGVVL
jgi:hypothetical protein